MISKFYKSVHISVKEQQISMKVSQNVEDKKLNMCAKNELNRMLLCWEKHKSIMSSLTEMSSPLEIPIVTTFQWGWRHYWLVTGVSSLHILLCFSPNLYIQSVSYSISNESFSFGLSFDGMFVWVDLLCLASTAVWLYKVRFWWRHSSNYPILNFSKNITPQ